MNIDIYQGDPKLIITVNGSDLVYKGGQPVMDRGLENLVLISLFTTQGWHGNALVDDPQQHIGSDFVESARGPITISSLNRVAQAAKAALDDPVFGNVDVVVTNPSSDRLDVLITIQPPGEDVSTLLVSRNGANWISQMLDPANERV